MDNMFGKSERYFDFSPRLSYYSPASSEANPVNPSSWSQAMLTPNEQAFNDTLRRKIENSLLSQQPFWNQEGDASALNISQLTLLYLILTMGGDNDITVRDSALQARIIELGQFISQNNIDLHVEILNAMQLMEALHVQAEQETRAAATSPQAVYIPVYEAPAYTTSDDYYNYDTTGLYLWMMCPYTPYVGPFCTPFMWWPYSDLFFATTFLQMQGMMAAAHLIGQGITHLPAAFNVVGHFLGAGLQAAGHVVGGAAQVAGSAVVNAGGLFDKLRLEDAGEAILFVVAAAVVAAVVAGTTIEYISAAQDAGHGNSGKLLAMTSAGALVAGACVALIMSGVIAASLSWMILGAVGITACAVLVAGGLFQALSKQYKLTPKTEAKLTLRGVPVENARTTFEALARGMSDLGYTIVGSKAHEQKNQLKKQIAQIKSGDLIAVKQMDMSANPPQEQIAWLKESDVIGEYVTLAQQHYPLNDDVYKTVRDLLVKHEIQNAIRCGNNDGYMHIQIINFVNGLIQQGDEVLIGQKLTAALLGGFNAPIEMDFSNIYHSQRANMSEMLLALSELSDASREKSLSNIKRHNKARTAAHHVIVNTLETLAAGEDINIQHLRTGDEAKDLKHKSKKQLTLEPARKMRTLATFGLWNKNNPKVGKFGGYRTESAMALAKLRDAAFEYNPKPVFSPIA